MSWLTKFKNALSSRRLDNDLDEELRDHLERRVRDFEDRGLSPNDARREAALQFGNVTSLRESSREIKIWTAVEATGQDVRYAWRGLLRNPVFTLTAVVSLSLAIGANTAIYSIVDAAMLRPLRVPEPDQLFTLGVAGGEQSETADAARRADLVSYPLYEQLLGAAGRSAQLALFDSPNRVDAQAAGADGSYENVIQQMVSPDAFHVLNVPPVLGRLFNPREDHYPSPRAVAVLSYEYWRRRFGADPTVVGRRVILDGRAYSVLGVAASGFTGVEPGKMVDIWLPVTVTDPGIFTNPGARFFRVLGRLAPGVSRDQMVARLQPAFHRYQESVAATGSGGVLVGRSGASGVSAFRRTFARPLWILMVVSGATLMIACANVASLLLARSSARAGEMALRTSLGAGRARLVRQLLTESGLLAAMAGACGWWIARIAAPSLLAMVSSQADPVRLDLALDTRIFLFLAGTCTFAAILFGMLPAWQTSNSGPMSTLRHTDGRAARLRMGRLFVGLQIAFAFCLVVGGAGFLFSLHNMAGVDKGFDSRGMTVLTIANSQIRDRQRELMNELQFRTETLPGVKGAATGWMAIFSGARRAQRVIVPGKAPSHDEETFYRVSPRYFSTLRTPLLSGRDLTSRDNDDEPVPTVVNRAFARKYFGTELVLGREFRRDDGVRHQITGLAANSHFGSLRNGPEPIAYMPMKPPRAFTLYVRSTLDAASVAKLVAGEAEKLAPELRVKDVSTVEALVGSTILKERLLAWVGGAFALLGLVLAAVGLFGLLNYSVARRTKEIGIRAALGAGRWAIYGFLFNDLAIIVAGGLAAGPTGAMILMRFTQSLLFEVRPADPVVVGAALAAFAGVAVIAAGLPVHRAASIDPIVALRNE